MTPKQIELARQAGFLLLNGKHIIFGHLVLTNELNVYTNLVIADACKDKDDVLDEAIRHCENHIDGSDARDEKLNEYLIATIEYLKTLKTNDSKLTSLEQCEYINEHHKQLINNQDARIAELEAKCERMREALQDYEDDWVRTGWGFNEITRRKAKEALEDTK